MRLLERKRSAFVVGGFAALAVFVFLACTAMITGGNAHIDAGGAMILFLFGGFVGLGLRWIYLRGRRDAYDGDEDDKPVDSGFPVEMGAFLSARPEYRSASWQERERAFDEWQRTKARDD